MQFFCVFFSVDIHRKPMSSDGLRCGGFIVEHSSFELIIFMSSFRVVGKKCEPLIPKDLAITFQLM